MPQQAGVGVSHRLRRPQSKGGPLGLVGALDYAKWILDLGVFQGVFNMTEDIVVSGLVGAETAGEDEPKAKGRGPRGRFAPGNAGGPGRPPRPVELHYLRAISDACPLETWRDIVQKAVDLAKTGDPQARAWLSKYLCGASNLEASVPQPTTAELLTRTLGGYDPLDL